jgi:hypothetical protein
MVSLPAWYPSRHGISCRLASTALVDTILCSHRLRRSLGNNMYGNNMYGNNMRCGRPCCTATVGWDISGCGGGRPGAGLRSLQPTWSTVSWPIRMTRASPSQGSRSCSSRAATSPLLRYPNDIHVPTGGARLTRRRGIHGMGNGHFEAGLSSLRVFRSVSES